MISRLRVASITTRKYGASFILAHMAAHTVSIVLTHISGASTVGDGPGLTLLMLMCGVMIVHKKQLMLIMLVSALVMCGVMIVRKKQPIVALMLIMLVMLIA